MFQPCPQQNVLAQTCDGLLPSTDAGTMFAPLADMHLDDRGLVLPASAWSNEHLISLLASINGAGDELPPPLDPNDGAHHPRYLQGIAHGTSAPGVTLICHRLH